jgi:outer membrane protein OmpA-like peptidoglycan-associated protein
MRVARFWVGAAIAAGSLSLAGCSHVPDAVNPAAWYRSATGQNSAEDTNQRNTQNLEAGSNEPYPNLATVPNVPSGATSTVDRAKLVDSLVADRSNAKYNNEQLEAGRQLASIAPPPAPVKLGPPRASSTAAVSAPASANTPAPSAPPAATAAPPSAANARGHEAPPQESTLTNPTIPSVPKGEAPPPPPPPAKVASTPPPAATSVAPAAPNAPPPAAPRLTPPPPPAAPAGVRSGQPSLAMRTPAAAPNPISVSVGDVAFAAGSSDLADTQRSALAEIAGLYKQTGGQIRIVGHAEPGRSSDAIRQRIAGLDLALDRANAVAQALAKLGVPAREIRVEAAPATAAEQPRAEVFMEY